MIPNLFLHFLLAATLGQAAAFYGSHVVEQPFSGSENYELGVLSIPANTWRSGATISMVAGSLFSSWRSGSLRFHSGGRLVCLRV